MPLSLGQAIGGQFKQDYNVVDPLLKGFQIGEARQRRQDLIDLKRQQTEDAAREKRIKNIAGMTNFKDIHPVYSEKYIKPALIDLDTASELVSTNDPINNQEATKLVRKNIGNLATAKADSKMFTDALTLANQGLLSEGSAKILNDVNRSGNALLFANVKDDFTGGGINERGSVVVVPFQKVDIDSEVERVKAPFKNQFLGEDKSQFAHLANQYEGLPKDSKEAQAIMGNDYNSAGRVVTAEDIATDYWNSHIPAQNWYMKQNESELVKRFPMKDGVPTIQQPEARMWAMEKFVNEQKNRAGTFRKTRSIPQDAQRGGDLSLDFGGGGSPTSPITGDANAINVVTNIGGQDFTETVRTTNPQGFKSVSVISTNSNNVIDADNNSKFGEGKTFEEVEVGQAVAVPIAKQDIVDKNSGITFKKGQMVPEKYVKGSNAALVEYVPYAKGTALVKSGRTSEKRSVLIPLSDIGNSVIASQSKDDAPVTKQMLQNTINDAMRANNRLPKVTYKKTTTKNNNTNATVSKIDVNKFKTLPISERAKYKKNTDGSYSLK